MWTTCSSSSFLAAEIWKEWKQIDRNRLGSLTEILGWPGSVAIVEIESPLVFVAFVLLFHHHQLLLVRLLPSFCHFPEIKNMKKVTLKM